MDTYENRFCVFVDVLGFKEHVDASVGPEPAAAAKREALSVLFDEFDKVSDHAKKDEPVRPQVTQFSDSLVVSFVDSGGASDFPGQSAKYTALVRIHGNLLRLIRRGFLFRGGIAYGPLLHAGPRVYGPALVAAAVLEGDAVFPRMLVTKEALDRLKVLAIQDEQSHYFENLITAQPDGSGVMDYLRIDRIAFPVRSPPWGRQLLDDYFAPLDRVIEAGLEHRCAKVRQKYEWAARGFHETVQAIGYEGRCDDGAQRDMLGGLMTKYERFGAWQPPDRAERSD